MTKKRPVPTESTVLVLETLGTQVRLARVKSGLTAAQLAKRAGVGPRTVTAVERGSPSVTMGNAVEIALAAGVSLYGAEQPEQLRGLATAYRDMAALLPKRIIVPDLGDIDV